MTKLINPERARKRVEAEARNSTRALLGDEGQLERLDNLFGPGRGALRERTRLALRLQPKRDRVTAEKKVIFEKEDQVKRKAKAQLVRKHQNKK